jgi:hypothetical protein
VVGFVVFLALIAIQFLVVSRGCHPEAERSEVEGSASVIPRLSVAKSKDPRLSS